LSDQTDVKKDAVDRIKWRKVIKAVA